jgi:hypothetical protein
MAVLAETGGGGVEAIPIAVKKAWIVFTYSFSMTYTIH